MRVGVGVSVKKDEKIAGKEAAINALKQSKKANFAFVFADACYNQQELLESIEEVIGPIPMIGCSGMGIIANKSYEEGVVVMTINTNKIKFRTTWVEVKDEFEGGKRLVSKLIKQRYKILNTVFIKTKHGFVPVNPYAIIEFVDPFIGNVNKMIKGMIEVAGPGLPIIGGSAGDNKQFKKTYQYCDWRALSKTVVACFLQSELPIGYGVGHGWRPISKPYVVTKVKENRLYEVDGKPAIEMYKEFFGKKAKKIIEEPLGKLALQCPIGMPTTFGNYILRHPFAVEKDGSIIMSGDIPEQAVIRIMTAEPKDNIKAAYEAAIQAKKMLGKAKPAMALIIDCGARYLLRGKKVADEEIKAVKKVLGNVPTAGFFTYGEQAPIYGTLSSLLNETFVLVTIGR